MKINVTKVAVGLVLVNSLANADIYDDFKLLAKGIIANKNNTEAVKKENVILKSKIDILETKNTSLKQKIDKLQLLNSSLENNITKMKSDIANFKVDNTNLHKKISFLNKNNKALRKRIEKLELLYKDMNTISFKTKKTNLDKKTLIELKELVNDK